MKDLEIQGGQLNYLFTEKCYNFCISFLGYKTCPVILSITRFVASSLHTHKKMFNGIWRIDKVLKKG